MRRLAIVALVAGSLSLLACAEARPPEPATAAAPAPPPAVAREASPVDAEMLAIGHAEQQIDQLFPEASKGGARKKAAPAQPEAAPPAPPSPLKEEAPRAPGAGDACAVACKALASMASSADRLCKLAGENDGRCDDARARVRGAQGRVRSACPACAATTVAPIAAPPKAAPPPGPAPGMPGSSSTIP